MESAAAGPRLPSLRYGIALLLGFGILVNYIDRVSLSVAGPSLQRELHVGPVQFGLLSSAFFWIYALLQIPIGIVLDRFGVVLITRVGAVLWGIAALLTAASNSFVHLFLARSFLGVAEAPAFPANAKATGYWFPRAERGLATAIFDAAAKFSNVIGVPLVAWLILSFGWRSAFVATAVLSFVYFVLYVLYYRNPSEDKRLSAAERDYIVGGGAQPEGNASVNQGAALGCLLRNRKVWGLTLGFTAYGYLFGLFITWLPSYLVASFHKNILQSAYYAAIAWGVATVTDLAVGGWLVDYLIERGFDPTRVRLSILIGGMLLGIAVVGAATTTDINVAIVWISISLGGIAASAPVAWSIPALLAPKGSVGTLGGIMNFFNNLANFAAPIATGFIFAATRSFALALVTAGVVLVVGVFCYAVLLGKIEQIPEPA
jgi:sugar phosphate permease